MCGNVWQCVAVCGKVQCPIAMVTATTAAHTHWPKHCTPHTPRYRRHVYTDRYISYSILSMSSGLWWQLKAVHFTASIHFLLNTDKADEAEDYVGMLQALRGRGLLHSGWTYFILFRIFPFLKSVKSAIDSSCSDTLHLINVSNNQWQWAIITFNYGRLAV